LDKLDYADIRNTIRDGDIVLFQGTSIFSRLIRWVTKSTFSHSGLAVWWGDRLMVLEATEPEVRVMPMSILIGHYPRVDLFSPVRTLDRRAVVIAAQQALGKKYAVWTVIRYVRRILFKMRGGGDPRRPPDKFVCSQLISYAYRAGGIDLVHSQPDEFTTPQQISTSRCVVHVGRLK
jgi:hypothetical protein